MDASPQDAERNREPDHDALDGPVGSAPVRNRDNRGKIAALVAIALALLLIALFGNADGRRAAGPTARAGEAVATPDPTPAETATPRGSSDDATATASHETPTLGPTLGSLAELSELAADQDAVLVLVPAAGRGQDEKLKAEIEAATETARSRGLATTAYSLSPEAPEYSMVTRDVSPPCVLAMVKGAGAVPVSGEITQAKIWDALTAAAQSGGCGSAGCGPSCR
ncbi:MAG TPA: hypothetical protein DGT21_21525 [Armatimonadetes bacterium]|jgi:hypothetical protein|nr:hypothetical protein [Armatimonadota bacterium]